MTDRPTSPVPRNAPSSEGAKTDRTLTPRGKTLLLAATLLTLFAATLLLTLVAFLPHDWSISIFGRIAYGLTAIGTGFLCLIIGAMWDNRG